MKKRLYEIFSIIVLTFFLYHSAKYNMQTPGQTEIARIKEVNTTSFEKEEVEAPRETETTESYQDILRSAQLEKFSCREISEGYELVLYGKENAEVFSAVYPKEPEILSVADDILEISVSTGNPSRYVFYFNSQNTKISETFFNPMLIDNKYVAYMEDDRLILMDIFKEGTLYEEIERDFSEMANSISAVISIELLENGDILLQYYKGEDMQIVTEKIKLCFT